MSNSMNRSETNITNETKRAKAIIDVQPGSRTSREAQPVNGTDAGVDVVRESVAAYEAMSNPNVLRNKPGKPTISIDVPAEIGRYFQDFDPELEFERNAMLIYPLIQNLTISHGRAAEILGISKLTLIDYYCSIGIPYIDLSKEEIEEEVNEFLRFKESSV